MEENERYLWGMQEKAASIHRQQEFSADIEWESRTSQSSCKWLGQKKGGSQNTSGFCFYNLNWNINYELLRSMMQDHFNCEHATSIT